MALSDEEKLNLDYQAKQVFTPATAVDERDLFAGRLAQIDQVIAILSQRGQHAIIFGERGVGKTSFANVITRFLLTPTSVIKPHINCKTNDSFTDIWKRVFSQVECSREKQTAGFQNADASDKFTMADTFINPHAPDRYEIAPDQVEAALERLVDAGSFVVVILDEFDRIKNKDVQREIADLIKSMSDRGHRAKLLVVGVADTVTDLIAEHQSVERALIQIPMPRMSVTELEEIVKKALPRLQMTIDDGALNRICLFSRGFPHYTHKLALYAALAAIEQGERHIGLAHVAMAINKTVNDAQHTQTAGYVKATSSPRPDNLYRHVLLACALAITNELGYFAASAVSVPLSKIMGKSYAVPSFAHHLKEFCDPSRGPILEKTGDKYNVKFRFSNPMMQPFVVMKGFADGLWKPIDSAEATS